VNNDVDWNEKEVPKEACENEKAHMRSQGFTVSDACPEVPGDPEKCIIRYRMSYE
jgi:hypothetical protein